VNVVKKKQQQISGVKKTKERREIQAERRKSDEEDTVGRTPVCV